MSVTVGAFEAKTHLSALLQRVQAGERVTITKHGQPIAQLVPMGLSAPTPDWRAFWQRVDADLVSLRPESSIKADIESGRL